MLKKILSKTSSTISSVTSLSGESEKHYESVYQKVLCERMGGVIEYHIKGTKMRVDILTDEWAVEVDFACKYHEAIGQSLTYATFTGKKAMIHLICITKSDFEKARQCKRTIDEQRLKIKLLIVDGNAFKG